MPIRSQVMTLRKKDVRRPDNFWLQAALILSACARRDNARLAQVGRPPEYCDASRYLKLNTENQP